MLSFHEQLQDGISDSNLIPVIEDAHIDEFAIDEGSIGALQILQNKSPIYPFDNGVLAGNRRVVDYDIASPQATDEFSF